MGNSTQFYAGLAMKEEQTARERDRARFMSQPSVMLGLIPVLDGNAWCVLFGEDIHQYCCGYGDTPDEAMKDFDKQWYNGIKEKQ